MNRRHFIQSTALGGLALALDGSTAFGADVELEEATITGLQAAMSSGKTSALILTRNYLSRIATLDRQGPKLNSVIQINPDAESIARELDRERKKKGPRGPLHGIPVLIKDNINTHDRMPTSAGSLALEKSIAPQDAFIVQQLRAAGAVILGKTNLSEWANYRGYRSTSGWSSRGGQTRNPYCLDRNPSGSSSGSAAAVSANFCTVAIGTETDGSIVHPSSYNGIVGLKPTLGLISRSGIIPIAHSQDTAGPMTRTVRDAAILLGALIAQDSHDPATVVKARKAHADYTQFLDAHGLRGARIGVARRFFGRNQLADQVLHRTIEAMKTAGATIVDPADLPTHNRFGGAEGEVLNYEFKTDLNAYLATLGPNSPVKSMADVIAFNKAHADRVLPYFGQEQFLTAQERGPLTDEQYLKAVESAKRLAGAEGIDAVMDKYQLDALIAPSAGPAHVTDYVHGDRDTGGSSSPAAVAGYPNITVPAGFVHELPVGLSFFGRAWSEPVLLKLAYGFEQLSRARKPPRFLPTLP